MDNAAGSSAPRRTAPPGRRPTRRDSSAPAPDAKGDAEALAAIQQETARAQAADQQREQQRARTDQERERADQERERAARVGDEQTALEDLRKLLRIRRVVQRGTDHHTSYHVELLDGDFGLIHVGSTLLRQAAIAEAIFRNTRTVWRFPPKLWPSHLQGLARLIEYEEEPDSTRKGETLAWVREHLERARRYRPPELPREAEVLRQKEPYVQDGILYVNAERLRRAVAASDPAARPTRGEVIDRLRELDAEPCQESERTEDGVVKARYWQLDLAEVEDGAP